MPKSSAVPAVAVSAVKDLNKVVLSFQLIRNTTSREEQETGTKSFVANLPVFEILKLNTKENLRSYLAEWDPRKRNQVHKAIRQTIEDDPKRFITRNGGFVIVANEMVVDDASKTITLDNPSIINGAQTQGEIRNYHNDLLNSEDGQKPEDIDFHVRAEVIVTTDQDEIVETAIARNSATQVKTISQAGAKAHLDELAKSISELLPDVKIQKKETDSLEEHYDTRKILQYARLLMPEEISENASASEKLRAYKNPEQCLQDFSEWWEEVHDLEKYNDKKDQTAMRKYFFTVQIAPFAIRAYEFWAKHPSWQRMRIFEETKKGGRACKRDRTGKITWVAPGLIYPILYAMGEFVKRDTKGRWVIETPSFFDPEEMMKMAVDQFRAHDSDPMLMGRSEAAYKAVRIYPNTLMKILKTQNK